MNQTSTPEAATTTTTAPPIVRGEVITKHPIDSGRELWAVRLHMPPGGGLPFWSYPELTMIYVESGAIGFTSVTGNVTLTFSTGPERAFTGKEYLLRPGDIASFGPGVQQSVRNPVTELSTFLVTTILPHGSTPFNGLPTSEGYIIQLDD